MEEKEVKIFDYLAVIVKWRHLFVINFLIVSVITAIISLIMPKWYRATAVILPSKESDMESFNLAALAANLPISGLGLNLGTSQLTNFVAILKSRTVRQTIAERFQLQRIYDQEDIEKTLQEMDDNIDFIIGKEGQIVIEVLDKSPQRSADMANSFVVLLDSINTKFKLTRARNHRILVERRFTENIEALHEAEQKLKMFQEKYGVIDIPEQTKAAITGAADLQAMIYMTEVELGIKEKYLRSDHAEVLELKAKLDQLKRKLGELQTGTLHENTNGTAGTSSIFIPFNAVPDLGLQYARLYRDMVVQNKLYEVIFQMYEQAKIQESKDTPTIQVLDAAQLPLRKSKPKRTFLVLGGGLISFFITALYVFTREFLSRLENSGSVKAMQWQWIREQIHADWSRIRRR
ncbi:hypothetical protein HUU05_06270 [candidate division KSB1 bacterium]|nr:hypothetical protein [candidate division KSB1 bacterium]